MTGVQTCALPISNHINREIKAARKGKPASIIIKSNSLVDQSLISKLYEAAKEGVDIKMIIRGSCCAITEHKSFKQPIKAISIIDEYLEHSRVFVFHNEGDMRIYISSGDWMIRNLDHRIEAACPIYDADIKKELIDILNIQLAENVKGRILDNEQSNAYLPKQKNKLEMRSQVSIYGYLHKKHYKG